MDNDIRKKQYMHDFDGDCGPGGKDAGGYITFSVGIFQWIPKASSKGGLKRAPVKYRVKGFIANPGPVYERAREICADFDKRFKNNKAFPPKKTEMVKTLRINKQKDLL